MKGKVKSLLFSEGIVLCLFGLVLVPVTMASSTIYNDNWAGFTFYKPNTSVYLAACYNEVPYCSLPPEEQIIDGVPMAAVGWVGVSYNYGGSPYLVQGGWLAAYEDDDFEYYYWHEVYPLNVLQIWGYETPGNERSNQVVNYGNLSEWYIQWHTHWVKYTFTGDVEAHYAHFILEAPEVNGQTAQLPEFTDEYLWMTFIGTSGGSDYGTYFYDNGWYVKWIIEQGDYVNTAVEYLPYPSDEDAVHVEWLTSAR